MRPRSRRLGLRAGEDHALLFPGRGAHGVTPRIPGAALPSGFATRLAWDEAEGGSTGPFAVWLVHGFFS